MMNVPFLDLGRAYEAIAEDADAQIQKIARSGRYILGENVAALEASIAEYLGVKHAVAVGSGTDALHLALAGLGIGRGDEVITTPFTFAATIEAIEYVGAQAVLVDIDAETYNIDPELIAEAITPATRAVMPVHLFGQPADMPAVIEIADGNDLLIIEDCAQSLGATLDGQQIGSFGDAGAFSFYPTKTLGCLGDGGMISTDDPEVDQRLRELRNHGIGAGGEHMELGFNSRLDEIQAAVLRLKLPHLDKMNERRREIAQRYNAALADTSAVTPTEASGTNHVFGYYTILVENRDDVRAKLADHGVATSLYYPRPAHRNKAFATSCRYGSLENAEHAAERCLSLAIFPEMTDEEIDYVANTCAEILS